MTQTWIARITPLYSQDRYRAVCAGLPAFRREKAERLRCAQKKAQSAGAWALLECIRRKYGFSEKAAFNLSHSGDYVICSLSQKKEKLMLGCDIEKIGRVGAPAAERLFCPSEYEYILNLKEKDLADEAICRFWVLKESFMKAVRKGVALGLKNIEVRLGEPSVVVKKPEEFGQEFYYREYAVPGAPYRIAVCADDGEISRGLRMELIDYFWEADDERKDEKQKDKKSVAYRERFRGACGDLSHIYGHENSDA